MWKSLHHRHPVIQTDPAAVTATGEKMDSMDKRLQWTEAALQQGNSQAGQSIPNFSVKNAGNTAAHSSSKVDTNSESVVPSIDFLRQNDTLQSEVDRRLAE